MATKPAEASSTLNNRLHSFMIDYITSDCRIMQCDWLCTWVRFVETYSPFEDLHPHQALRIFISEVLPRIFDYDLTPEQEGYFKLLTSHPRLKRHDKGFTILSDLRLPKDFASVDEKDKPATTVKFTNKQLLATKAILSPDPVVRGYISKLVSNEQERLIGVMIPAANVRTRLADMMSKEKCAIHPNDTFDFAKVESDFEFVEKLCNVSFELMKPTIKKDPLMANMKTSQRVSASSKELSKSMRSRKEVSLTPSSSKRLRSTRLSKSVSPRLSKIWESNKLLRKSAMHK